MSARRTRSIVASLALVAAWASLAFPVRAAGPGPEPEPAPPDSSIHGFLDSLSDSTDRYFGMSAAPLDTAGLGGELTFKSQAHRFTLTPTPTFDFSRVDGSTFGAGLKIAGPQRLGRLDLHAAYAVGSETWLGGARYRRRVLRKGAYWSFEVGGGRETAPMNRDHHEPFLDPLRALANGTDRTNYLRHDGWQFTFDRESNAWRAGLGFRDQLESPLATTAWWNLFNQQPLIVEPNLPAAFGRTREILLTGGMRLPVVPFRLEADYWTAGPGIGSDFTYDRVRAAVGGDVSLGRWASLVPQAAWATVHGSMGPQQALYLGAGPTLVTVPRDALGGTSFGMAKVEIISANDLLGLLHIHRPELLSFQPSLFAATGAVGGADPFGGPDRPGDRWPEQQSWMSEAGIGLHYDPGLLGVRLRFAEGWPLGPSGRTERFVFVVSHPLDLLRKPIED